MRVRWTRDAADDLERISDYIAEDRPETEEEAYRQLRELVVEEVEQLQRAGKDLPPPITRPMREAVPA